VTPKTEFSAEQFAHPYPDGIQFHYWTRARNALVLRALRTVMADPGAPVLDLGCGRGVTVDFLRQHGVDATGADLGAAQPITPEVAPFLHLGRDAFTLPAAERRSFRALLLLDVLEHLPAPADFLRTLGAAFENARDFVVTLPARQELWTNYDAFYGHHRRYDLASARALFSPETFEVTSARYLFRLLDLPALALAVTKRGRATSISAPAPRLRWAHRLLSGIFEREASTLPGWVPGSSLMITVRRRTG
jgi:hypothetical protein